LTIEKNSPRTSADKNKELESVLRSHQTRIRVVGCGGGGNNTITRLTEVGVKDVETLAVNTDAQDLLAANADDKILIGKNITKGLGAGSNPQIGEDSARENQQDLEAALQHTDLVFVTCGLGGGTGTGSAPIVAEISKKLGALTVAVVTLPFAEEGVVRWENAKLGLEKLRQNSDTIIVIQNDRLFEVVPDLPLGMAFKYADEILVNAVKGITELITEKGLVNLDFADVRAVMQNGGTAMIGIGESDGAESAQAAVEAAMQNKLLDIDIAGAKSALINVTGGAQMPLKDAKRVMQLVAEKLDGSAKLIWGARIDPSLDKSIRVMLIVTGLPEKRREDRKVRVETASQGAPPPAVEHLPEGNGVEQNLSVIGQLVEALVPEVQISARNATRQVGDEPTPQIIFAPAETQAESSPEAAEAAAPNSEVSEKPKRKRKTKSSTPQNDAPIAEVEPQAAKTVESTAVLAGGDEVAGAIDGDAAALQAGEFKAPPEKVAGKLDEAALPEIEATEQVASAVDAAPQRNVKPAPPAEAPKPKTPPASRSEVPGKINASVPPRSKAVVPAPNANPVAGPLNANRGTPRAVPPQAPPANRSAVGRGVNAPRLAPPARPNPALPGREQVRRVPSAGPGAPPPPRPHAPMVNRQQVERASNGRPLQPARPRPPLPRAPAPSGNTNLGNPALSQMAPRHAVPGRPQPMANKPAPVASHAANYNKLFEEKSLANLQTIRESIGHLFIDPARQETLRCMKSAALAINNLAQRFAFKEIADYAATVEEICTRVLDGEINMNKKILNAFTEMPGIFEGMIQGDADAIAEAKRHQERLKRLTDSVVEGEVLRTAANAREQVKNPRPPMGAGDFSKPSGGQRPAAPANHATQQNARPKPATEVMEYLDDLFSESKIFQSR
jgi:cell division protein FtsZ